MSNYLAIATVTATLVDLLKASAANDVGGTHVINLRPDLAAREPGSRVNVYLYQVTPNASLRNVDVPTRRSDGSLLQRPIAALDLHYMISFYGDDTELVTHRLLGGVVRTLHTEPFLTREKIRDATNSRPAILGGSNLSEQIELVKFSPLHLSLEEFSKIWSVFYQIPYVLSVAYQGTVVLIESEDTPASTLPVRERNVYAVPFHQPIIEQIRASLPNNQESPNIVVASDLIIKGQRLRGDVLPMQIGAVTTQVAALVRIGEVDIPIALENVSETKITLSLSTAAGLLNGVALAPGNGLTPLTSVLRAGVQGLQVIHQLAMGTPLAPHRGVESNVAPFVLHPTITNPTPAQLAPVNEVVTITVEPIVSRRQRVVLLLNEITPPPALAVPPPAQPPPPSVQTLARMPRSHTYSFIANNIDPTDKTWKDKNGNVVDDVTKFSGDDTNDTIRFAIPRVVTGKNYLVRIQVDGAESLLTTDADGRYIGPQVTI